MLDLSDFSATGWRPPILDAVGTTGDGVAAVWDAINRHREHESATGELARRRAFRAREELREIVAQRLHERAREICTGERWDALSDGVADRSVDPWAAADEMLPPVDA